MPAAPVKEDAVDCLDPRRQGAAPRPGEFASTITSTDAQAPQHRAYHRLFEPLAPAGEHVRESRGVSDQGQAAGELGEVPVDRFGLPAEGIETVMVEIGRG